MPPLPAFRPLLLALALTVPPLAGAQAVQPAALSADATVLTLSAEGEARQVPDVAVLSAGVIEQAGDSQTALRRNASKMTAVLAALHTAGIAERDIQTAGVRLTPQYRHEKDQAPTLIGYQASNTVRVKVRDLARLGPVIDALAAHGANRIDGPGFEIDDPAPLQDQARQAAIAQLRQRAELYAKVLGLRVRRVISLSENVGSNRPMPMLMMARAASAAEADTPIAPGQTTITVGVEAVFELGR